MSHEIMFRDAIDELRERGSHFAREAYVFVVAALGETVRALPADRLADAERAANPATKEIGGRDGPEPTRYGDWEKGGIASDF